MTNEFTTGDVLREARAYLWVAGLALVLGLLFLVAELLSPDLVIWTGHCVPAQYDGGIAHYTVAGQPFTADTPALTDRTPRTVTVCYQPSDPGSGYIVHSAAYLVEGGAIGVPIALAIVIIPIGLVRARRRLRRSAELPPLPTFRRS